MTLLDALGGNVQPSPGWETRAVPGTVKDRIKTVGICNHYDAIRGEREDDYYISGNRYGGLIYNIVINRDGLVRLLGQRLTWNAGSGDPLVLNALKVAMPPPLPSDRWNGDTPITPVTSGNAWLFGVTVNFHPDFEIMDPRQYAALVRVNAALLPYFGLTLDQMIQHRHWTRRKRDIGLDHNQFRLDVQSAMEDNMLRLIRQHWTRTDIQRFRAHNLYVGEVDYWANDLGIWAHGEAAWDAFTAEVVAKGVSRGLVAPTSAGGVTEARVKEIISTARVTV